MSYVKWNKRDGIVDAETGKQLLQLIATGATKKFRDMAGKELANKLNTIARAQAPEHKERH